MIKMRLIIQLDVNSDIQISPKPINNNHAAFTSRPRHFPCPIEKGTRRNKDQTYNVIWDDLTIWAKIMKVPKKCITIIIENLKSQLIKIVLFDIFKSFL